MTARTINSRCRVCNEFIGCNGGCAGFGGIVEHNFKPRCFEPVVNRAGECDPDTGDSKTYQAALSTAYKGDPAHPSGSPFPPSQSPAAVCAKKNRDHAGSVTKK